MSSQCPQSKADHPLSVTQYGPRARTASGSGQDRCANRSWLRAAPHRPPSPGRFTEPLLRDTAPKSCPGGASASAGGSACGTAVLSKASAGAGRWPPTHTASPVTRRFGLRSGLRASRPHAPWRRRDRLPHIAGGWATANTRPGWSGPQPRSAKRPTLAKRPGRTERACGAPEEPTWLSIEDWAWCTSSLEIS